MNVFIYQADIYCEACARAIMDKIHDTVVPVSGELPEDSDRYPQGPYGDGGGEADCPQHCGACLVFLENPLTGDGESYVREQWSESYGRGPDGFYVIGDVLELWADFYDYVFAAWLEDMAESKGFDAGVTL